MKEIRINLPDQLASDANAAGLLAPDAIEAMLRATLKANAKSRLDAFWSKLDKSESTPEREAEILEQVRKVRAKRKAA
jgi:hypothetical protein